MNIQQMHEWYRQYAQQMGMQNVRVLLPEQIDLHINTSIYDTIKNIIAEHIALTNRTVNENSKVGQLNLLSTLYRIKDVSSIVASTNGVINLSDYITLISNRDTQSKNIEKTDIDSGVNVDDTNAGNVDDFTPNKVNVSPIRPKIELEALYITSLSIDYVYTKNSNREVTDLIPIRLIDDTLLANSMQDPALKPSINYPIAVITNNNQVVYLGKNVGSGNGKLKRTSVSPNKIRIGYIGFPAEVSLVNNVSCDLPESMHIDILKHAVDLNTVAIQGSLFNSQKQQQRELQENASQARQQRGEDN